MTSWDAIQFDSPVTELAVSFDELWSIVTHPAFRIGYLDARCGRPHDHDRIAARILAETPSRALQRLGFDGGFFAHHDVALAQYRYEEGRRLYLEFDLRCRGWSHPDHPPTAIRRYIDSRAGTASDAVVCRRVGLTTPSADTVEADCAWCGHRSFHRPQVPKRPPKVCLVCAVERAEGGHA